jgi:hypothetical protein
MNLTNEKKQLVEQLIEEFGTIVTRKQVEKFTKERGLPRPRWLYNNKDYREARATYSLQKVLDATGSSEVAPEETEVAVDAAVAAAATETTEATPATVDA